MIEASLGSIAKSYGQSPQPVHSLKYLENKRADTEKFLAAQHQKLLTQGQQEKYSKSGLLAQYNDYLMRFLRTPAGYPLRQTFKRLICTVVLGTPYSGLHTIINSINTLSILAVTSLTEDPYGRVAKDVPLLVRAYASTIQSIEGFVISLPPHWTDVEFAESDRKVEEVELVVSELKRGLGDMVKGFGQYSAELGMSEGEIAAARKVAGLEERV